ncbi:exosortase B [Rubrivivax gelatinosus]|nr:exosortase B [Rubrivivax gelatinosus]
MPRLPKAVAGRQLGWLPAGVEPPALLIVALAFALLYVPTYIELATTIWATDEQSHGPIILAIAAWLLFGKRHAIAAAAGSPAPHLGWPVLGFALLLFAFGASQQILLLQVGSQILVLAGLLLIFGSTAALRVAWFPLFFLLFMVPLPEALVAAVTAPLKSAVSASASWLLYGLGYPVGRSGVVMTVGPYQLLVADACAGLNSMFTLEALGMLYMNLMRYTSVGRNVTLGLLLVPIAFVANIARVMILVLVTYHFGDAAGQGFVHGFAGLVLFVVALVMMLAVDRVLGLAFPNSQRPPGVPGSAS